MLSHEFGHGFGADHDAESAVSKSRGQEVVTGGSSRGEREMRVGGDELSYLMQEQVWGVGVFYTIWQQSFFISSIPCIYFRLFNFFELIFIIFIILFSLFLYTEQQ